MKYTIVLPHFAKTEVLFAVHEFTRLFGGCTLSSPQVGFWNGGIKPVGELTRPGEQQFGNPELPAQIAEAEPVVTLFALDDQATEDPGLVKTLDEIAAIIAVAAKQKEVLWFSEPATGHFFKNPNPVLTGAQVLEQLQTAATQQEKDSGATIK